MSDEADGQVQDDTGTGGGEGTEETTLLTGAEDGEDTGDGDGAGQSDDGSEGGEGNGAEGDQGGESDGDAEGGALTEYADFELPEGFTMDAGLLEKAAPILLEAEVPQETAQALVTALAEARTAEAAAMQTAAEETRVQTINEWVTQTKADKDIGGDNLADTLAKGEFALRQYPQAEALKVTLKEVGYHNHPEVIRFLRFVGDNLSEDNPGSGGTATSGEPDVADIMYPKAASN